MLYYMLLAFVNWLRVTLILLTTLLILKERKKQSEIACAGLDANISLWF